jgi:hypothetical protein
MKTAIIILVSALALFIFLFILSEISLREEINKWAKEVAENGKLKEMNAELEKKLDFYKSCEQTFKVEKVVSQPLELQCRLQLDADFPEDIKREFVYKRLCKELDRVFKENPDICLIKTENNLFDRGVDVKARIRFLPYIHGAEY